MRDLYAVLGVAQDADVKQIQVAFRQQAKTCHPDLHGGSKRAEQRFKTLGTAYETLRNPESRATYDSARSFARMQARQRFRAAVATMSATFVLTVSSGLLAGLWAMS